MGSLISRASRSRPAVNIKRPPVQEQAKSSLEGEKCVCVCASECVWCGFLVKGSASLSGYGGMGGWGGEGELSWRGEAILNMWSISCFL